MIRKASFVWVKVQLISVLWIVFCGCILVQSFSLKTVLRLRRKLFRVFNENDLSFCRISNISVCRKKRGGSRHNAHVHAR